MTQPETASAADPSSSSGRRHRQSPSDPPPDGSSLHSTDGSSEANNVAPDDSSESSNLVALCHAGQWDQVREWLLMWRLKRDDAADDPCTTAVASSSSSSRRRREVSACPRVCGIIRLAHFADHGTSADRPCQCDTALSIACGLMRVAGADAAADDDDPTATAPSPRRRAPVDVIEALWRYCPEQLAHVTSVYHPMMDSGAPLHHALWAVRRRGEGEGEDGAGTYCSDLDLVECLVDAEVAVSGRSKRKRGKTSADEEEPSTSEEAATLILGASRLLDHGSRTPLQIWVQHIFPILMTLEERKMEDAMLAALTASIAGDDATSVTQPGNAEEEATIFRRWIEVLRKLLVAWPCACSVPDASWTTLLITVLRWESLALPPSREVVERRLLDVVRTMLGKPSSSDPSTSGGATYLSCSSFGCSPLHYAVEYKRSSAVIGAILDATSTSTSMSSSSSTTQFPLPLRRNNDMEVPLHVAAALRAPLSVMGLLLRRRPGGCAPADQTTAVAGEGRSPLTWAYIRFLEHYHGLVVSRRRSNAGPGEAVTVPAPAQVPRARRKIFPLLLKTMEEAVLGSLQQCTNREELLSELGTFWDVAQLLLISAHHGRGITKTATGSATPTLADARSFLGIEASARLTEQVRGVLAPGDLRGKRWRVVHAAASLCPGCCPRGVLAIAIMVRPDELRERDEGGRLPLHLAINTCFGGGDLTSSSHSRGESASPEEVAARTCWAQDENGPSAVQTVLAGFPDAAGMTDGPSGRLPLHVAIEGVLPHLRETSTSSSDDDGGNEEEPHMMGWTVSWHVREYNAAAGNALDEARLRGDVRRIAMAHPEALGEEDAPTGDGAGMGGLLPFMIAAAEPHGSTSLSYELLRYGPDVISRFIPPDSGKEKGESDGGFGGSATSPGIRGPVPGSSSPPTSPGRSSEARGNVLCGVTAHKRARCS